ncbi:pyroglutamyl-peptidase 1 [Coccinella septempunctata]|uniref:pyroglutamyl-peptidase 1 n=1 Tax=Coccinella septempunctata TaxID=41139 RepID=UPI001D07ACF4|nr:pyroglutamyl-peptidase 1 [Coccinella septempunctata]XP_044745546.1 pyroglutamyl-peptidase 1 [Coccinella septempunctata]
MTENNPVILVTGFGPFGVHLVNASWEAVKLLPDEFHGHRIVKKEIPVCYKDVDEKIPNMWMSMQPKLVIHVGVSSEARKITIEKTANRNGYEKLDCFGKKHSTGNVCPRDLGDDFINTSINVPEICEILNSHDSTIKYCSSENAGRYLCEYIYYTSLRLDRNRCIFIHVPPLDSPYTAKELSDGILQIINCVLKGDYSQQKSVSVEKVDFLLSPFIQFFSINLY